MLTLKEAATYLGYRPSGLRKLAKRGDVRFCQSRAHAPLKFKREWLDQYIEAHSARPGDSPGLPFVLRKKKTPSVVAGVEKSEFGFDSSLLNL